MREIAKDAGINHALINYHFRTKDQLVIAVLDAANRRLLYRQREMYRSPGGFAAKWAQARRFYENDLASGFVRVQAELWAASLSNPGLREQFLPQMSEWRKVVFDAVREAFDFYRIELPPPFSPEVIACWITEFWIGMEMSMLIGTSDAEAHHRAALDAVQRLLEELDRRASAKSNRKNGRNVRLRQRV
jgi:AcrR family transcriptional regulator